MDINNYSFLAPEFFFLIPIPFFIWMLFSSKHSLNRKPEFFFPQLKYIQEINDGILIQNKLKLNYRFLLLFLIWTCLTIAIARPVKTNEIKKSENLGYDIMLVLDTSLSMNALDFSKSEKKLETRLSIVKNILADFINKRADDHIGLISFGNYPILQSPLTTDNQSLIKILNDIKVANSGKATAIGDALALATKKLLKSPNNSRVIILLTDGENTYGSFTPIAAANISKEYQIPIHTIGIGTNHKVPFLNLDGRLSYQHMNFNPEILQKISALTNGKYFFAKNTKGLSKIYAEIDKLIKHEFKAENIKYYEEYYTYFLYIAAALWLITIFSFFYRSAQI